MKYVACNGKVALNKIFSQSSQYFKAKTEHIDIIVPCVKLIQLLPIVVIP